VWSDEKIVEKTLRLQENGKKLFYFGLQRKKRRK
jgi:hypothetical protein